MTSKEFNKISQFYRTHYNLVMKGHVWIFPQAINEMSRISDMARASAYRREAIYLKPLRMRIEGEYFRIQEPVHGLVNVHRKWVQSVLLNHFNY